MFSFTKTTINPAVPTLHTNGTNTKTHFQVMVVELFGYMSVSCVQKKLPNLLGIAAVTNIPGMKFYF